MTFYIWLIFTYEIFGNLQTEFARRAMMSPMYNLSVLERSLWKKGSPLSLAALLFLVAARINGVVFLIYLGFKTAWWHPIIIWVGCLISSVIASSLFKGKSGLAIPALLAFAILPITGIWLWGITP